MTTRTLCLSLLVLVSTAFPAQAVRLARTRLSPHVTFSLALAAIAGLAWFVTPLRPLLTLPFDTRFYAIAVGAGLAAPFVEYVIGSLTMRRFARLAVHERSGRGAAALLAAVAAAAAEEALFRGVAFTLLEQWLVPAAVIAITSVVYGLNHLYFGWLTVWQKTLTGVGFGALFVLSGHSLVIPLIAHVTQNLVVLLVLQRRAP